MTVPRQRPAAVRTARMFSGPAGTTRVVLLGIAVAAFAWVTAGILGYQTVQRDGPGPVTVAIAVVLAVAVGSAARIPIGALTDRYGARRVLPTLLLASAVLQPAVAWGAPTTKLAGTLAVGCLGGAAVAVAGAAARRQQRPRERGLALAGAAAATAGGAVPAVAVTSIMTGRGPLALSFALLTGVAGLAAAAIRDTVVRTSRSSWPSDAMATLRLSATRQWCLLYAAASGPLYALLVYLPAHLTGADLRPSRDAAIRIGALVAVAAAGHPVGAWLTERMRPARVLASCYLTAGILGVVVALDPPAGTVFWALLMIAAALGLAAGAVLDRLGRAVPPERAGLVLGVVGAAGAVGGLLPLTVLWLTHAIRADYTVGIMLLAGLGMAAASHLHRRRDWINPLTFPLVHTAPEAVERPEFRSTGTTVVALTASDTAVDGATVIAILTELITRQELVVVYGDAADGSDEALSARALVAAVRDRLPRHKIIAVMVDTEDPAGSRDWETVEDLVAEGAIPFAVLDTPDIEAVADLVAERIGADAVVALTEDPVQGVHLRRRRRITSATALDEARTSTP